MAIPEPKTIPSRYPVRETIDRLENFLKSKGIKIFARFDQSATTKMRWVRQFASRIRN
jgi:uncharacterized protein (DUF302 family)